MHQKYLNISIILIIFIKLGYNSFKSIEHTEFKALLQHVASLGAKYGKIDIEQTMPNRKAISQEVVQIYLDNWKKIRAEIQEPLKNLSFCVITDIWTDQVTNNSFIDISGRYISTCFKVKIVNLAFKWFPVAHTADNILREIDGVLSEYNINHLTVPYVTDCGSNFICALKNGERYSCHCHRLSTCIETAFNKCLEADPESKKMYQQMKDTRTFFSHSADKSSRLPRKLPSDSQTRPWKGLTNFFSAFVASYGSIKEILIENGQRLKFPTNEFLLKDYSDAFSKFSGVFDILQSDKTNLHECLIQYVNLKVMIADYPDSLQSFREALSSLVDEKIGGALTYTHLIATFMHPNYKSMNILKRTTMFSQKDFFDGLEDLMINFFEGYSMEKSRNKPSSDEDDGILEESQLEKEQPVAKNPLMDPLEEESENELPGWKIELKEYRRVKITSTFDDPLMFWKNSNFQMLKGLARSVYAISASSAQSERNASRAGLTITPKRNRMNPMKMEKCLFININSE